MSDPQSSKTRLIQAIIADVCELPDYNSPDDQPELLQCTVNELSAILENRLDDETSGYVEIGELVHIEDGLCTVFCQWNEKRDNLPPGTKVYGRVPEKTGGSHGTD